LKSDLRIVVISRAHGISGGPEALHQLVDMANEISPGIAAICYSPFELQYKVPEQYRIYNVPMVLEKDIPLNALIILPEIFSELVNQFKQKCAFWWLSVDNFFIITSKENRKEHIDKMYCHLSQSCYSSDYIKSLGKHPILLQDYINDVYFTDEKIEKKKIVATNPAKGKYLIDEFTKLNPDIKTIELSGMSKEQIKDTLCQCMIYVDFGHHPGKDRLPRESRILKAIVLTIKNGSAKNDIDIPIDDWYKFNDVRELSEKINDIFINYEKHDVNQSGYLNKIKNEKEDFRSQVKNLIQLLEK